MHVANYCEIRYRDKHPLFLQLSNNLIIITIAIYNEERKNSYAER